MKIGLIFPNKDKKDKTVHLGLGYLASYARIIHNDLEFSILDTRVATKKETGLFFDTKFDLIGITVLSPVYYEVIHIFQKIRKYSKTIPICLGGPYVTTIMEDIFKETNADFAIYGEGEITFSELLFYLKGEKDIKDINGLMYISASGDIITNLPREQIKNIDDIPFPAYDLFQMHRYPMHRIATSRGCPYTCVFCNSSSIWLGKWRKRNAHNIFTEIEFLIRNYGRKSFFFNDNSFNIDNRRVEELCDLLILNDINILWSAPVRADKITQPLANKMKKAGCYNVGIGVESVNNRILEKMQKHTSIEDISKGIRIFKNTGIEVLGQFVIGSPDDNLETIKESIAYAQKSDIDFVMFYSILPFKGTPQWDYIEKHGQFFSKIIHDYHSIKLRIVFDTPDFPYSDRLKAINMVKEAGYYSDSNDKSSVFDFGKDIAKKAQGLFPAFISNKMYVVMKNIYRKYIWKNNLEIRVIYPSVNYFLHILRQIRFKLHQFFCGGMYE